MPTLRKTAVTLPDSPFVLTGSALIVLVAVPAYFYAAHRATVGVHRASPARKRVATALGGGLAVLLAAAAFLAVFYVLGPVGFVTGLVVLPFGLWYATVLGRTFAGGLSR